MQNILIYSLNFINCSCQGDGIMDIFIAYNFFIYYPYFLQLGVSISSHIFKKIDTS